MQVLIVNKDHVQIWIYEMYINNAHVHISLILIEKMTLWVYSSNTLAITYMSVRYSRSTTAAE